MKITYDGRRAVIEMEDDEADLVAFEAQQMIEWTGSALRALAALRRGSWTTRDTIASLDAPAPFEMVALDDPNDVARQGAYWALNDIVHRWLPRLEGIVRGVTRDHAQRGGTARHLALAMDVDDETAARRQANVVSNAPTTWESWATGELDKGSRRRIGS